ELCDQNSYFTETVIPFWLAFGPTKTSTWALPGAKFRGTTAFTCNAPATSPGAAPKYVTVAGNPPIRTAGAPSGYGNGRTDGSIKPSTPAGEVWPCPVAKIWIISAGPA